MSDQIHRDREHLKHLPYSSEIDSGASWQFQEIKTHLGLCVVYREMGEPLKFWLKQLNLYINLYKLKFSKNDHVLLVKLLHDLVTVPNLPLHIISTALDPLHTLLTKRILLPREDLMLPWKPLYDLCRRVNKKAKHSTRAPTSVIWKVNELAKQARFYFNPAATREILDELRPLLCPFDKEASENFLSLLSSFLPLTNSPELADSTYNLWLPEMMQLWKVCNNNFDWDKYMISLLTNLAEQNIGNIDWDDYLPTMYVRLQSSFELPLQYRNACSRRFRISSEDAARWIVCTLGGRGQGQEYLDQLLSTLESYCQSANEEFWTGRIKSFLITLAASFNRRIRKERFKNPCWKKQQLTDEDIRRFVVSMQPIAMPAIFTVSPPHYYPAIFRELAELRPDIIVPPLLERLYAAIECVTEPHRFTALLQCVLAVARPMLCGGLNHSYHEGKKHVIPLLFALLPGLDVVDLCKSWITLDCITTFSKMISLVDCSSSLQSFDLTELEKEVASATTRSEEFVLRFMDRVFVFVESVAEENIDTNGDREQADAHSLHQIFVSLENCCRAVLEGTSPEIYKVALKKLYDYLMSEVFETTTAGPAIACILKAFADADAKETFRLLIPALCEPILDASRSQSIKSEENVYPELLYKMFLLTNVVCAGSPLDLKPYLSMLMKVVDETLHAKCKRCHRFSRSILANILKTLNTIRPMNDREQRLLENTNKQSFPIREWGQGITRAELNIRWYVPREEEISIVEQIFWTYLVPELERIDKYNNGEVDLSRDDIRYTLDTILELLISCASVLKIWTEEPWLVNNRSAVPYAFLQLELGVTRYILMPDGSNVFKVVIEKLALFQSKLLQKSYDALAFTKLSAAFLCLCNYNERHLGFNDYVEKSVNQAKMRYKNRLCTIPTNLRSALTEQVHLQHIKRVSCRGTMLTQVHKSALVSLLNLATSDYEQVQSFARQSLLHVLRPYTDNLFLVDGIVENLKADTTECIRKLKGTLMMFKMSLGGWTNFEQLKTILPAIVTSSPTEDISVHNLLNHVMTDTVAHTFWQFAVDVKIPDNVVDAAKKLWVESELSKPLPSDEEIEAGWRRLETSNKKAKCDFNELIAALVQAVESKNLHWRYELMADTFIYTSVVPNEEENPPEVARCFLNMLIHSSPILRECARRWVLKILKRYKAKTMKEIVDPFTLCGAESSTIVKTDREHLTPGPRPDNEWCRHSEKYAPQTEVEWNKARYSYRCYSGFCGWPKDLRLCSSPEKQPVNNVDFDSLSGVGKEIDLFFVDESNVAKLVGYLCLVRKGDERHSTYYSGQLLKYLFKIHCDRYLENFKPHVEAVIARKEKSHQVCAAGMLSGIIMGAKHWPFDKVQKLIEWYIPLLKRVLDEGSLETLDNWARAIVKMMLNFDVNKNNHLYNVLMDEPIRGSAATVTNCGRLIVLQAIRLQSWRLCEIWGRLLDHIKPHLANRYQELRSRLALVLGNVFETDIEVNGWNRTLAPRVGDFIDYLLPRLNVLYSISSGTSGGDGNVEEVVDAMQLLKTFSEWCTCFISNHHYPLKRDFFKIFPLLCLMENYVGDDELRTRCRCALSQMCCAFVLMEDIPFFLDAFDRVCERNIWCAKCTGLEFLQVFIVHKRFLVSSQEEWISRVTGNVLRLLVDNRCEVRLKAGEVMSGMFHYRMIKDPSTLIEKFKANSSTSIKAEKSNLNIRHAGIIGLCSFINAYPYTVPPELPPLFVDIGNHLMDPEPIAGIIGKTLNNFRRTHFAEWEQLKFKFTDDQLEMLADFAMPPDHFA